MTLILLGVVGVLAAAYLTTSQATTSIAHRQLDQKRAFWAAEAGIEHLESMNFVIDDVNEDEGDTFDLFSNLYDDKEEYRIVEIRQNGDKLVNFEDGDYENDIIKNNGNEITIDFDQVVPYEPITFVSKGDYKEANERIEIGLLLQKDPFGDDPWNFPGGDEVLYVEDVENNKIEIGLNDNLINDDITENHFNESINSDLSNKHLDIDGVDVILNSDGNFEVEYDITDSHPGNQTEYLAVSFSLDRNILEEEANPFLFLELEISDWEIQNYNKLDEIEDRVKFGSSASDLDTDLGDGLEVRDLFGFSDDWPSPEDLMEDIDEDNVVHYCGEDEFSGYYDPSDDPNWNCTGDLTTDGKDLDDGYDVIIIHGDLSIRGASSQAYRETDIYVKGDITDMRGAPNFELERTRFFVEGVFENITGNVSDWDSWFVDYDSADDPSRIDDFTDWAIY